MNKRTILVLSAAAIALAALGIIVPGVSLAATANIPQGMAALGGSLFALGALLGLAGWAMALIHTARIGQWGWFVAIVLFNAPGALAYGIAGPEAPAMRAAA